VVEADSIMPAKGTRKLSDRQKVDIVVQKQIKPKKTSTYAQLASTLEVSEATIKRTTLETLNERQRELYDETVRNLKFSSLSLTAKSIEKASELIGLATEARELAGVVAAGKFGHEVYRLETNQPTQIIQEQQFQLCISYIQSFTKEAVNAGLKPSVEDSFKALMVAPIQVPEDVRQKFVEGERKKVEAIGENNT
jgi:hypothetical protein